MKFRTDILAIIILSALLAFLVSCDPVKRQARRCSTCPVKIDRSDTTIIERETIIDTVYKSVTVTTTLPNPCEELCDENGKLKNFTRVFPTSAGSMTLTTRNDSLVFQHRLDSIMNVNKNLKETVKKLVTIHEQVAVCSREHLSDWQTFQIIGFRILAGIIGIVGIGWYLRKRFF